MKFSAHANFGPGQFWLSSSDKVTHQKLGRPDEYVLTYLAAHGASTLDDIKAHADRCTEGSARNATFDLVTKGYAARVDNGQNTQKGQYALTEAGKGLITSLGLNSIPSTSNQPP